jgi:crotonobetaine/carnitine-CoA ligase
MTAVTAATGRDLWRARVAQTPDREFLMDNGRTWTFAAADDTIRRLAGGLAAEGVTPRMRVLVALGNHAEAFFVHGALRELGAVIVPLVPGLTFAELAFQIGHSAAPALILGEPSASVLAPRLDELPALEILVGEERLPELQAHAPLAAADAPPLDEHSPWAIFYTSGSTGRPKGVVLPAGAFVSAGLGYAERFGFTEDDTYLVTTPMSHAVGGLTAPSMAIRHGGRLAIVDRFSPSRFWDDVAATGATVSIMFPAQLNLLLEVAGPGEGAAPPSTTFRLAITHSPNAAFHRRFGAEIGLCWGMTETGAASTGSIPGDPAEHPAGYVGRPMDGVQLAILDDDLRPVAPGAEGEICLRHRHQMLGYLDDAGATARTLLDGWVHSGDRGRLDADGGLVYRGRIKNMIKRAGENISPEEIEVALDRHPAVAESLVVGVPDALRTEEAAAIVVPSDGGTLDPEQLAAFVGDELARWKAPRYIAIRPGGLPRLPNGKIDRTTIVAELDLAACWDRERARTAGGRP